MQRILKGIQCAAIYALLLPGLSGCGSSPSKETAANDTNPATISLEKVTEILNQADQYAQAERTFTYLNVTQALLDAGEADWARNTFAKIPFFTVPDDQYIRYSVIAATLAVAQGQIQQAKRLLWEPRLDQIAAQAPDTEKVKLHEVRAQILYSLAEYRASVNERITLHYLLGESSEESEANQDMLWQTMMELPFTDLKLESQIQSERLLQGWYTLAALSKDNQTNLREQIRAVDRWAFNWPDHPASLRLPADLQLLQQLADEQPSQIALLLPFGGRFEAAASAIRDGIMAAFYDAASQGDTLPDLRIYDTSSNEINYVYDQAVSQGAQLIIGPLEQGKIAELALRPALPVPTLALNRIAHTPQRVFQNNTVENSEGETTNIETSDIEALTTETSSLYSEGLFQFGLPLEDEAEQVAKQAWRDGHRRAMVLAPASSNGDRSIKSFSEHWLALGGELVNDYRYNSQREYSNLIKSAVKIKDSELRKRELRSIIGKNVEFEPRRRKDIDFIFLYSQASQARQLKPILAFHYAGDIPVYAIKDIFNGKRDAKRDKDLNQIRFTTLPWFFDNELPEKQAIIDNNQSTKYQFLYALGVDAYHLHPRLRQLKEVKQANFYGTTGKLYLDEQQRVKREQIWAKFVNGVATPVTTFSSEHDF